MCFGAYMCLSHQNFSLQVGVSASICMKERKGVNLQFATQKCKFPFVVLCIDISSIWYKACLDHSGIRNILGLSGWVQEARPSANLGYLARQRQLHPYGSFSYECLATVILRSVSWSTCKALAEFVAASAFFLDWRLYDCWLHVEGVYPCEKPCVAMKTLQSSACGQWGMEAVRSRALSCHGCTLCQALVVVRGAAMAVRRGIGGRGTNNSSWDVQHGMDEDQLQKSRGILCHENRATVVGCSFCEFSANSREVTNLPFGSLTQMYTEWGLPVEVEFTEQVFKTRVWLSPIAEKPQPLLCWIKIFRRKMWKLQEAGGWSEGWMIKT